MGLSVISAQQSAATEKTTAAIDQLLDHVATYPNDAITYRPSDMFLAAHSDAGFNNNSKAQRSAGDHIFLSEERKIPQWNGAVLTIAQIIKFVILSAVEAELGALYITYKEMIPVHQALIILGWKQPPSAVKNNNSTAEGLINNTIIQRKIKPMDLRFHWLRCRELQGQIRYYWAPGKLNWAD